METWNLANLMKRIGPFFFQTSLLEDIKTSGIEVQPSEIASFQPSPRWCEIAAFVLLEVKPISFAVLFSVVFRTELRTLISRFAVPIVM